MSTTTPDRSAVRRLPEHPASTPLTAEAWSGLTDRLTVHDQVVAEQSFFSLACWRGGDAVALSRIGGVVVVALADAARQVMLVVPPGASVTAEERAALAALVGSRDVRYVSAASADRLAVLLRGLPIGATAERDDADYVYRMADLATMAGPRHRSLRRAATRFDARCGPRVVDRRLPDDDAFAHLLAAYDRWCRAKYPDGAARPPAVRAEHRGVRAWPRDDRAADVRVFCLEVDGRAAGVSVVEPMRNATWMGLVMKTDPGLPGATAYLRRHVARAGLAELGPAGVLNVQQDEGLPGLRHAKQSYRPLRLERKFRIHPTPTTEEHPPC